MKYLLVIAVILVAFWVWRNNRQSDSTARESRPSKRSGTTMVRMVECRHCGTHLPETEALQGSTGWYCSSDHRRRQEPSA